jgi:hypothetical protein
MVYLTTFTNHKIGLMCIPSACGSIGDCNSTSEIDSSTSYLGGREREAATSYSCSSKFLERILTSYIAGSSLSMVTINSLQFLIHNLTYQ